MTRSVSLVDLPGEAVVRLEGDDVARLDLEDGLEIGAEGPDHLVTREPVLCHVSPVRRLGASPRHALRVAHTSIVDDDPPICPACGVTMVPAALSAEGSSDGEWVCLECEETGGEAA